MYPHAMWLRAGLVGMLAGAGGIASLAGGIGSPGEGLAWLAAGVALTIYSWRRFRVAITALEAQVGPTGSEPARAAFTRDGSRPAPALQA
jgi:hypothetical protein